MRTGHPATDKKKQPVILNLEMNKLIYDENTNSFKECITFNLCLCIKSIDVCFCACVPVCGVHMSVYKELAM